MTKRERFVWEQMKELLIQELGTERGTEYLTAANRKCDDWLTKTKETSPTRLKTMRETILPRVATYAVLKENGHNADTILDGYVRNVAGPMMHDTYAKAEKLPGFWTVFKTGFIRITEKSDRWECESRKEKDRFFLDIHKCLWYDTCVECGYPEVCRLFCECDNYTYGGLNKIGFIRTQTLGTGGEKCDFVLYKK